MRKRSITRARACIRTGARAADSRHAGGTARRAGGHCRRRGTARDLASPVTRLEQHSRTGAHRQADTAQPLDAPCVRARNAAEHPRQNRRQSQGAGVRGNDKPARSDQKVPRHGHGCRSWVPVQLTQRWQHPGAANDVPVGPLRAGPTTQPSARHQAWMSTGTGLSGRSGRERDEGDHRTCHTRTRVAVPTLAVPRPLSSLMYCGPSSCIFGTPGLCPSLAPKKSRSSMRA